MGVDGKAGPCMGRCMGGAWHLVVGKLGCARHGAWGGAWVGGAWGMMLW